VDPRAMAVLTSLICLTYIQYRSMKISGQYFTFFFRCSRVITV